MYEQCRSAKESQAMEKIESLTTDISLARPFLGISVAERYAKKITKGVRGCNWRVLAGKIITIEMTFDEAFGGVKHYFGTANA